jgi:hypothetical protein
MCMNMMMTLILIRLIPILKTQTTLFPCHYPPFNNLSLHSNSHVLSPHTTPISPAPPTLSSKYHDLLSQQSSYDAHIKRSRYDVTSPQSPYIIQISKKIKLHTQLSTHSPNNTLNLDYVINTDNENNTYIC